MGGGANLHKVWKSPQVLPCLNNRFSVSALTSESKKKLRGLGDGLILEISQEIRSHNLHHEGAGGLQSYWGRYSFVLFGDSSKIMSNYLHYYKNT